MSRFDSGGWHEVTIQQVRGHRQVVLRVRRDFVPSLVACPDAVLSHQPLNPFFADREPAPPQLPHHSRAAVCTLEFFMNGTDPRQHLCVSQPYAVGRTPVAIAARSPHVLDTSLLRCRPRAATEVKPCGW